MPLDLTIEHGIATLTFNRPPVNALNPAVVAEVARRLADLAEDRDVGVVVLTGAGDRIFIAGADIDGLDAMGPPEATDFSRRTQEMLSVVESFPKVVLAALNGSALGGGLEVALACDVRIADERAVFGLPEVGLGVLPGAGGTQRLARLVGIGRAKELIFTGDPVDAATALAIGLVERVAKAGEALTEAKRMAQRILTRGPLAVRNAKEAINFGQSFGLDEGLARESRLFGDLFATRDQKEGVRAFLEKRKPHFRGD